ncbi:LysR family transcriptional regulator [Epibacterium ulvae]|uniref:LysR family transcriptional regulator n=1 Tax=Epibacterium ulvae TaxID=1156985 RepID=UPI001BFCCBC9|nr:LysR family transcriptional regulator [Epibacterium ulvae]MBT8153078.1 LysR family transcriptional regulator [Epibacterium ulvae]
MEKPEPDIWRNLAVLLAVGEVQSPNAAGQALGLSQNAVASRIDQLEARMGSVLVKRAGARWFLTEAGQGLAEQARSIAGLVERSRPPQIEPATKPVVLGCPELFFEHLLLPVWYRIQRELPVLPIRLRTAPSVLHQSVEGADLTLCLAKSLKPGQRGQKVGQVTFDLYAHRRLLAKPLKAAPSHFTVEGGPLSVSDLTWPELGPTRRVSCANLAMVAAAVKSGRGIGLLPHFVAQQDPALLRLDGVNVPEFSLWILQHDDASGHGQSAPLRDLLLREIAQLLKQPKTVTH